MKALQKIGSNSRIGSTFKTSFVPFHGKICFIKFSNEPNSELQGSNGNQFVTNGEQFKPEESKKEYEGKIEEEKHIGRQLKLKAEKKEREKLLKDLERQGKEFSRMKKDLVDLFERTEQKIGEIQKTIQKLESEGRESLNKNEKELDSAFPIITEADGVREGLKMKEMKEIASKIVNKLKQIPNKSKGEKILKEFQDFFDKLSIEQKLGVIKSFSLQNLKEFSLQDLNNSLNNTLQSTLLLLQNKYKDTRQAYQKTDLVDLIDRVLLEKFFLSKINLPPSSYPPSQQQQQQQQHIQDTLEHQTQHQQAQQAIQILQQQEEEDSKLRGSLVGISIKESLIEVPKVPRYPVVLSMGSGGDKIKVLRYFRGVKNDFEKLGVKVLQPGLETNFSSLLFFFLLKNFFKVVSKYGTLFERSSQLSEAIIRFIEENELEKVNIIAHSMGGLDSRNFISSMGGHKHVASLTTIGTPHRGTAWADYWVTFFLHPTFFPLTLLIPAYPLDFVLLFKNCGFPNF